MIPSSTTNKKTPGVPIPLNTVGAVFESSSKKVLPIPPLSTTQTEVSDILKNVSGALPPEEHTRSKEQAQEFQARMELFAQEVERVRKGFGYGYGDFGGDYKRRLSVSNKVVIEVSKRILTENEELRKVYEEIMGGFSGNGEKLKERIVKEYGGDLVYEGMKEEEYSKKEGGELDCIEKSAKEVKKMVVEFARNGRKGLNLGNNGLNEIFTGEPELFKEMVVGFARFGGKWFDLWSNGLNSLFTGEPELFKEMIVEFARFGGKWFDLRNNGLHEIFIGKPELFKDMVVGFAEFGGEVMNLCGIRLYEIFIGKPELFKDMVVGFAGNGGKELDLRWNNLTQILDSTIEIEGSITRRSVREIIKETCTVYGVTVILDQ